MRSLATAILLSLPLAATTMTGCASADGEEVGEAEDDLTKATLQFQQGAGEALSLKSGTKLLTCTERFSGIAGDRVTCSTTGEKVQVILKKTGKPVVVRDVSRKRAYYTCTTTGRAGSLPKDLKCTETTLRKRGTGGLSSPFDSSVTGISIPNAHWVGEGKSVLRGMEPRTPAQFSELKAAGIKNVVIFKNPTGDDDVGNEIEAWGLPEEDVLHVPFKWKDLDGFKEPCEQTLEALAFIKAKTKAREKVFFHCTVGEDRTGYLAALYRVIFEDLDARKAFDEDMCEHGYGSGNPQKPGFVTGALDDGLGPLYRSMAYLVSKGALTKNLETSVCAREPSVPANFMKEPLKCGTSTTLVP
ncbi:MAG: tyrosine-protein phosphatase [Polyangiaceae bacterium]